MQICNIDSTPLLKILLHAAKYPALAINGILLGTVSSDGGRALQMVDAVPLCHGQLHLAMAIETGLSQVISWRLFWGRKFFHALPKRSECLPAKCCIHSAAR